MKLFRCQSCGQALFFENSACLGCRSRVGYVADAATMAAIEPVAGNPKLWRLRAGRGRAAGTRRYRRCRNAELHGICNFLVPEEDSEPMCVACRLTRVVPDLSQDGNKERWHAIELAKRRLFATLAQIGLLQASPAPGHAEKLHFEFLQDRPGRPVLTGHLDGLVTINISEADDEERTRRRLRMHEPYRTLLGHLRHESGHHFWDVLIRDGGRGTDFAAVFGDASADYGEALANHYRGGGCPSGWDEHHVSPYATCHPWEDWAETWAHYLHMVDLLETAASYHTRIDLHGNGGEAWEDVADPFPQAGADFDDLVRQWRPLTLLVNSLNRSLGQPDAYPFALSQGALRKLRFVHDVVGEVRASRLGAAHSAARSYATTMAGSRRSYSSLTVR